MGDRDAGMAEGGDGPAGTRGPATLVSPVNLYSYLVTRHTGRAVRLGIQERLAEYDRRVLAVVDFREVQLIDFSCADEVVAKLVIHSYREAAPEPRTFFLFTGMDTHHVDPVVSALRRQKLVVAAQRADGSPALLGSLSVRLGRTWHELVRLGRASPSDLAGRLGVEASAAQRRLEELHERRLLLRDREDYVSFRRALVEAGGDPTEA